MLSVVRSSKTLGTAFRRARRIAGLTQKELGTRTSLRQATISSLENGQGATLDTVFTVLTVLNLELQLTERTASAPTLDDIF
jgi:HTH-type transcriptional regulator/antitoxin HipB